MPRPLTIEDLDTFETDPVRIGEVDSTDVFKAGNLDLISAMFTFLDKCREQGWHVEESQSFGGTTYRISRPKTKEELERSLDQAQSRWDRKMKDYEKAQQDATEIHPGYGRTALNNFIEAEGLEPIDWEAADRIIQEREDIEARAKVIAEREARRNAELAQLHAENSDAEAGIDWHDEEEIEVEANND